MKRYDLERYDVTPYASDHRMVECKDGEWVRFEDVESLKGELSRLKLGLSNISSKKLTSAQASVYSEVVEKGSFERSQSYLPALFLVDQGLCEVTFISFGRVKIVLSGEVS